MRDLWKLRMSRWLPVVNTPVDGSTKVKGKNMPESQEMNVAGSLRELQEGVVMTA